MAVVLLYNIEKGKAAKLKMLCRDFYMESREVARGDFGFKIADLLSENRGEVLGAGEDFDEEMLYFADISPSFLGIFLDQMRRKRLAVALKAIKTETNAEFTSYELYKELSAEREAMSKGKAAH